MRRKITEKIFKIIAKKKEVVEEDPDYIIIADKLKELPDHKINDFYIYLVSDNRYFNDAGFMMPFQYIEAVNNYKIKLLNELWEKHDIKKKTKTLYGKIQALHEALRHLEAQQLRDYLKSKDLDTYKTKKEENFFSQEEIEVIKEKGIHAYLEDYQTKFGFESDLKIYVENEYKSYITKNYFYYKDKKIMKITLVKEEDNNE